MYLKALLSGLRLIHLNKYNSIYDRIHLYLQHDGECHFCTMCILTCIYPDFNLEPSQKSSTYPGSNLKSNKSYAMYLSYSLCKSDALDTDNYIYTYEIN